MNNRNARDMWSMLLILMGITWSIQRRKSLVFGILCCNLLGRDNDAYKLTKLDESNLTNKKD